MYSNNYTKALHGLLPGRSHSNSTAEGNVARVTSVDPTGLLSGKAAWAPPSPLGRSAWISLKFCV